MDELVREKKEFMKEKIIEKSLYDLNDKNSNIMLTSGYLPLLKKESLKVVNKVNQIHEDQNFEVQFQSRILKAEDYVKYFIAYYSKVSEVEFQMNFKKIVDQKTKYSITK